MRVVIEPPNSPPFIPKITGPVLVSHSIKGGATTSEIPVELTPAQKDASLYGRVRVFGRDSCCWEGIVWGVDPFEAVGIGTLHSFVGSTSCYATNNLEPWIERTVTNRAPWIHCEKDANALRFFIEAGDAVETQRYNGLWRILEPVPTSARVTFSWALPGYANWMLKLYTGSQPAAATAEVAGSWTNRWTDPQNANSGTASVDISAAFDTILFQLICQTSYTASGTTEATISNLKIYGRSEQMTTARIDDFMKAMISDLPTWSYILSGAGATAARRWISSDSTEVWPLEFKAVSDADKIGDVIDRVGGNRVYAWIPGGRIQGSDPTRLVPALWTIPADPAYYVDLTDAEDWSFDPLTLEQMADSVVAEYNTADNQEPGLFYLQTDTNPLHVLPAIGRSKREFISTRATTAAGAQAAAAANLALRAEFKCRGQIKTSFVMTAGTNGRTGAAVPVESVLVGYRIGIIGHPSGMVLTPIITDVQTDGTTITLTVDSRPYGER